MKNVNLSQYNKIKEKLKNLIQNNDMQPNIT